MTVKTKASIKSFFETLDKPTAVQFVDFIDSYQDQDDTLDSLVSVIQGSGLGVIEITATGATSIISASAGLRILKSDQPASARGELGSGTVGDLMFLVETTAAGRDLLAIPDIVIVTTAQTNTFGIVELATQTEMEAASITDARAVTPGQVNFHPGVLKFAVLFDGLVVDGVADLAGVGASFNVASVVDVGTGVHTINIDTDFSSANWFPGGICDSDAGSAAVILIIDDTILTAGVIRVGTVDHAGSQQDSPQVSVFGFGDQ